MDDDSGAEKTSTSQRERLLLAGGVVLVGWLLYEWAVSASVWKSSWLMPLGLAVVGLLALIILWKLPQWQVKQIHGLKQKERFDRINEARKTLATILGGVVLLAGFFGTWRNLQVAQEGQITDRFTKAIEQLGAVYPDGKTKLDVRLGGIYALERIANDSERDHWPIMEVLCTYVREHAPATAGESPNERPAVSADIQAILTVLGRRNRSYEKPNQVLNLGEANLSRANLSEANLSGAYFAGQTLAGQVSSIQISGGHTSSGQSSEMQISWEQISAEQISVGQTSPEQASAEQTSVGQTSTEQTFDLRCNLLKGKSKARKQTATQSCLLTCTCRKAGKS